MERKLLGILLIVIFILLAHWLLSSVFTETKILYVETPKKIPSTNLTQQLSEIKVPAVDNEGNGVVTLLRVEALPGEGKVLVNINQLLFWVDTQYSIIVAEEVAEDFTEIDLSNIDLSYTIETNASVIGGQSAGAAITVATIAALENKTIDPNTMITGTIRSDGSIGQVGAILAKAKAAKDVGATLFLVPPDQAIQINYKPVKKCEKIGPITYCSVEYEEERIDISEEVGIEVKEVSTLQEALKYFLV
jgi:uncharacterized protein